MSATGTGTGITAGALRQRLEELLQPSQVEVIDESAAHAGHAGAAPGGGTHFRVRIASPRFAGLSRVQRHRLVYDALREFIDRGLHALAVETL